jgi:hypothetical protein
MPLTHPLRRTAIASKIAQRIETLISSFLFRFEFNC